MLRGYKLFMSVDDKDGAESRTRFLNLKEITVLLLPPLFMLAASNPTPLTL